MIEVKVPEFGESIQEVQIAQWLKKVGEFVAKDEDLVELESEKASQALPSPEAGILKELCHEDGAFVQVGDIIGRIEPADGPADAAGSTSSVSTAAAGGPEAIIVMPAAERLLSEHNLKPEEVVATGPGGRLLKEDVLQHVASKTQSQPAPETTPQATTPTPASQAQSEIDEFHDELETLERADQIKPMSMIRRTIAKRLVEAQNEAALLTTFNEIDMQPVMELRSKYKEQFQEKHGVKLGFMSFFAKASVEALKRFPAINSQIDGNNVVYRNYCDVGIAIGGGKGLVVPILRSVERLSFAAIERTIGRFATLAQANKIKPEDLAGGTFTISNGGVYGSLLSTPIVNPPQSGILGLHSIQKRPVVVNDEIVIRPMMYVALTYDHRIVDGREAVQFLKTIKEVLEEPARLFLEV